MRKFRRAFLYFVLFLASVVLFAMFYLKVVLPHTDDPEHIKIEPTQARIERGKYLAYHVAVCMDCHSQRDWQRFSGPMVAGSDGSGGEVFDQKMGFPGVFYAKNLTPYNLKNWTDGELLRAITSGIDKDGKALFPLMAYHRFGRMDKDDVLSIIAFLRTLPEIKKDIPVSKPDFPVNFLINTMPLQADFQKRPPYTNRIAYGKYLANAAGCVDCHSKTDKGKVIPGTEFGGGMAFEFPEGTVTSPNLTMHETGLSHWNRDAFIARFKMYADPTYPLAERLKDGYNSPMPWTMYAGMHDDDLDAIYEYLKTLPDLDNEVTIFKKRK